MSGDNTLMTSQLNGTDKTVRSISHRSAIVKILESRPHTKKEIHKLLKESFGADLTPGGVWNVLESLKEKTLRGKAVECKKIGRCYHYYLVDRFDDEQPIVDSALDQVVADDGDQSPVEPGVVQIGDVSEELINVQGIRLSPEEEISMADGLGLDWAALISDLNRTGQCETLISDQRRATLLGGYYDKGLSSNKIASSLDKPIREIKSYLRYHRFISSTDKSITSNVSRQKFHEYWIQVRDPQDVKNRSELGGVEERIYFRHIEGLVAKGQAPIKVPKKYVPPDVSTMKTVRQIKAECRRRLKENTFPHLDSLISLCGADRATFSPTGVGAAADKVKESLKNLYRIFAEIGVDKEA